MEIGSKTHATSREIARELQRDISDGTEHNNVACTRCCALMSTRAEVSIDCILMAISLALPFASFIEAKNADPLEFPPCSIPPSKRDVGAAFTTSEESIAVALSIAASEPLGWPDICEDSLKREMSKQKMYC